MKSLLSKKTFFLYWFSYFLFALLPITINAQTVPGAPTIGMATATGATTATVSFTAPTNNGGSTILKYVATSSPAGITGIFTGAGSGTITITGLTSDIPYNFTITAVNEVGASIPSNVSNWVVPGRGPNAPTNVVAVAGNKQASITFTPPTDDGGTPILIYRVVASPGNIIKAGASSPIIVPELTNGIAYTFVVTAENSAERQGTPSAPSNSVTPGIIPDAPTIGTATATGRTTATVAFTAPSYNGGLAITSYAVTSSPAGGSGTFTGAGSGTISVSNLTHSTNYTFSVKAVNGFGSSNASAASNQITTPSITVPDAPTIGTATATGRTTATVAFTAPSNNGGFAIVSYAVTSSPAGGTGAFNGAGSGTISVSNLTHSTNYTFSVKAVNEFGSSNASAASNQITTPSITVPDAPTIGTATATGSTTATVAFTAPSYNGGSAIIGYVVTSSPAGGSGSKEETGAGSGTIAIINLTHNTNYTFTVKAVNGIGSSNASAASNQITTKSNIAPTPPAQPMVAGQPPLAKFTAVGADAGGGPLVTITFNNGTYVSFFAYASSFTGGVRVALGDINGDGNMDVITGAGAGGGPQVNVYNVNASTGAVSLQKSFFAFNAPSFTGGIYVATGRTNDDIYDDIIIGAGATGGSRVQVYEGSATGVITTSTLNDFFAYSPAFTGGVRVAAGDRNGDGYDEVITAPASNGGYNIKSFNVKGTGNSPTIVDNFFAFNNTSSVGGLSIASGYLNTGKISDIIVGTSNGIFGVIIDSNTAGIPGVPFAGFTGTINVGVAEDANGIIYPMALAGPSGAPRVVVYKTGANSLIDTDNLFVMNPAFKGGLFGTPGIKRLNYFGPPNIAPSNITLSKATIDENNSIGASIGTLTSTDPDVGDSFTYSLVSGNGSIDNSKFTLSGNTLKAAEAFNFESKSSYKIRLQTTDAGGLSFQKEFTLTIVNVNETPTAIILNNATINENNAIDASIGTLASTDPDAGDSFTYSLVSGAGSTDNRKFTLSGNTLKAAEAFDFETKSSYLIRIQTTDAAGLSFQKEFTLTIVNVNEAPTAIALSNAYFDENNAIGATIGTLNSTDSDVGDSFTYSLVSGTGSTDNSKFTISGNTLKAAGAFNFEIKSRYSIRIQTSDLAGSSFQKEFTLIIVNANEAPTAITLGPVTIDENNAIGATIGTLASTDSDAGDSFTYSLVSGTGSTDNNKFTISGNTLKAAEVFDFETKSSYSIRIQTSDLFGLSFQKEFTLTIGNVNEAPTALTLSNASIDENNAIDASIGTLGSTDTDAGTSFTYSLVSGAGSTDNSKFTISGNTLKAAEALDFETKSSYSIRIQTSDAGGLSFQKTINISVKDINDSPSALVISRTNVFETNPINQIIGLLSSSDQDAGDSHSYSLVSGSGSTDNADFNISGTQLRAAKVFSFVSKSSYSIRLRTTDKAGLSFENTYSVTISQLPTLTGTGNEAGSQTLTAASTSPKISKGYKSNLQVSGSNLVSYSWSPSKGLSSTSIANPVAELTETATYSVLVSNSFGSSVTLSITIEVMEDYNLVASNLVSPNGDGVNDNWQIENLNNYPNNELVISDRNNNILYRQKNYSNNWDGQYNGSILPSGTYYYLLTFNSGASVKRGYITIINHLD
jgi:gliding motility-associated-like protein